MRGSDAPSSRAAASIGCTDSIVKADTFAAPLAAGEQDFKFQAGNLELAWTLVS